MKFKKDDIVEVIKEENWRGIDYPVGTQLRVCEDQGHDYSTVSVYDSLQKPEGCAKLWEWNLKLVKREGENEMNFKTGEQYRCVKAPNGNFTEGKVYELERNYAGQTWLRGNDGLKYTSEQCTVGHRLNTTGLQFEKVHEEKEMRCKVFDLNNLTTAELREYVDLLEEKEVVNLLLECFIEKVTK